MAYAFDCIAKHLRYFLVLLTARVIFSAFVCSVVNM